MNQASHKIDKEIIIITLRHLSNKYSRMYRTEKDEELRIEYETYVKQLNDAIKLINEEG